MALDATAIATVTAEVTARLDDDNLRGNAKTKGQVAGHAVARCVEYAPEAPADSVREAAWRYAAWLIDTRPGAAQPHHRERRRNEPRQGIRIEHARGRLPP